MVNTVFTVISVSKYFCPGLQKHLRYNVVLKHDFHPGAGADPAHFTHGKNNSLGKSHLKNQALKYNPLLSNGTAKCLLSDSCITLFREALVAQHFPQNNSCLRSCSLGEQADWGCDGEASSSQSPSYLLSFKLFSVCT